MHKRLTGAICMAAVFPAGLVAQGCGALTFSGNKEVILNPDNETETALVRQTNGSYSAIKVHLAPFSLQATYANFQNYVLSGCPATPLPGSPLPAIIDAAPTTGTAGEMVAIADFQNTGMPSVVFGEYSGTLHYGSAKPTPELIELAGTNITSVAAGDFNKDGKIDYAAVFSSGAAEGSPGGVEIFLGNGAGAFAAGDSYITGQNALEVTVADLNKDGNLDLVVSGDGTSSISVLLGKGDGSFTAAASPVAGQGPVGTLAADVNNDKNLDLVTANEDGTIWVFLGNGDGTFQTGHSFQCGSDCVYPAAGDFNGDGNLDLAVSNFDASAIAVLLGDGTGAFGAPALYSGGEAPATLILTDFNNDGNLDILTADGTPDGFVANLEAGDLDVLLGNGDGTFQGTQLIPAGIAPRWVDTADFNGDGKTDMVAADEIGGSLTVLLGQGNGKFPTSSTFTFPSLADGTSLDLASVVAADFNGDGKPDAAAVANEAQTLAVAYGTGTGTFQNPLTFPTGNAPVMLAAGDLNRDGKPDLVVANSGATFGNGPAGVSVFLNTGTGFQSPKNIAVGSIVQSVAIADVNLDGNPDLIVADAGDLLTSNPGGVWVLLGAGNGSFQTPKSLPVGSYPNWVSVGDVNNDGKPDLVVITQNPLFTYFVAVLLGNGDGTFQAPNFLAASQTGANLIIKDFNGDGKPDLVVTNCCGIDPMTYFLGNGDGTFQPEATFSGGPSIIYSATADFNGDGKPDLGVINGGGIAVLLNETQAPATQAFNNAEAAGGSTNIAQSSLVSAYANGSTDLGPAIGLTAQSAAWPTNLGGTTVSVMDSSGTSRPAQIYYAQTSQVNYAIPAGTALGAATVTITPSNGPAVSAPANIVAVQPGIFSVGPNLAAANVIRVVGSTQTVENDYMVSGSSIVARPIPLDAPADQVYLVLYASGVRNASAGQVTATVGGASVQVQFFGPQGGSVGAGYPGLDQINIGPLPASLTGAGSVTIQVTAAGVAANPVSITVE